MKKSINLMIAIALSTLSLSSCGVMFGGSKFTGSIIAKDHPNAKIFYNGNEMRKGADVGLFPRNKPLTIEVKQDGCEPKTQTFNNTFRTGNFILSAISWGLIGIGVDLGTGAAYKPDHINDPSIEKVTTKNFTFTIDYSGCPVTAAAE